MWEIVLMIGAGLLIGVYFRLPALIGAALATVVGNAILYVSTDPPAETFLVSTLVLVLTLQAAYLIGLLLAYLISKHGSGGMIA